MFGIKFICTCAVAADALYDSKKPVVVEFKLLVDVSRRSAAPLAGWLAPAFSCPFTSGFRVKTPAALCCVLLLLLLLSVLLRKKERKKKIRWPCMVRLAGSIQWGPSRIDYAGRNGWFWISLWQFDLLIFLSGQLMVVVWIMILLFRNVKPF